jgi:hypothetical protein
MTLVFENPTLTYNKTREINNNKIVAHFDLLY